MTAVNSRVKDMFRDRHDSGPAQRSFTVDEATFVARLLEGLAQRGTASPRTFSVDAALRTISSAGVPPEAVRRYLRPMLEFLQSQVNVGLLMEVTPTARIGGLQNDQREFAPGSTQTSEEWARSTAAASLGLPYAAHVFGDVAVRVHHGREDEAPIGSGVVISRDWILTNAHVVKGASTVAVSWGGSAPVEADEVILSPKGLDLAVVHAPGFDDNPLVWFRRPRPAEPVIVLAYPEIPQVASRPLLRFNGWVASDERVTTYFGDQQVIVSAIMGPGASGGPIFGADGCLVGIVVQSLEGKRLSDEGHVLQSSFHAALPGDLLLDEVRAIDLRLSLTNTWASTEEWDRLQAAHASQRVT